MSAVERYLADRRERREAADHGHLAYYYGSDLVASGRWDEALQFFRESLRVLIARSQARGTIAVLDGAHMEMLVIAMRSVMAAKNALQEHDQLCSLYQSWRQQRINNDLFWNSWRDIFGKGEPEESWRQRMARQSDEHIRTLRAIAGNCLDCGHDPSTRWQPHPPCQCGCHDY